MGGWMVTWLHAHKELQVTSAAFFFQMTRFRPVRRPTLARSGLVFGRPTEAFVSLLGSSFGACREQRGRGQFTVSPVPLTHELHGRLAFGGFTLDMKPWPFNLLRLRNSSRCVLLFGTRFWSWKFKPDWHEVNCPPPPPWRGVNEDGFGWLVRAGDVFCLEKSILHL